MTSIGKLLICVCALLLLAANQADAALYRMDDFELLTAGTNIDGTTPNSDSAGPGMKDWDTHSENTGFIEARLDPSGALNMVLAAHGYSGGSRACVVAHSGSSGYIIDTEPAKGKVGEVGSLFVSFYVDSADPNTEAYFGISSKSSISNADSSSVNAGVAVYNDPTLGLGLYQMVGGGSISSGVHFHIRLQDLEFDTWYNIWVVADRTGDPSIDQYDAYLNTGGFDAVPADQIIADANFSNSTEFDLKGYYATCRQSSDFIYFDDIYMDDDAEDLTNPVTPWGGTSYPSPADGEELDTAEVTLKWKTGVDPTDTSQPNPAITKHYLYVIDVPIDEVLDWSLYLTEIPAGNPPDPIVTHGPLSLSPDTTYSWAVDESVNDSGPSDPETIYGRIWSFETEKTVPEIIAGPTDAFVFENETAEITIDVNSMSETHYAWYKGPAGDTSSLVSSDSNTLTITNAQVTDEGTYWCRITNAGGATDSGIGRLVIKRALAHWTLDEADYEAGQYQDVSGNGHHADVVGTPNFVADVNGNAAAAAQMGLAGGYATAGTWDPSAISESLGVTAWINPSVSGTGAGIVGKRESWGDQDMRWTISYHTDSTIRFVTQTGGSLYSDETVPVNEWTHMACTYDLVTDQAKVYLNAEDAGTDTNFALDSNDVATVRIGHYDAATKESEIFTGDMDDVRIYNYALSITEVAAFYYEVTGEAPCINPPDARFDLDNNCRVDFGDYAIFVSHWLDCGRYPQSECQ